MAARRALTIVGYDFANGGFASDDLKRRVDFVDDLPVLRAVVGVVWIAEEIYSSIAEKMRFEKRLWTYLIVVCIFIRMETRDESREAVDGVCAVAADGASIEFKRASYGRIQEP